MTNKMVYQFKNGPPRAGLNPQEVGESLSRLEEKHGHIKAEHVVEDARPISSSMHNAFDWDNNKAAEQWRLEQAKNLIRSVIVVSAPSIIENNNDIRAFVSIPMENFNEREYLSIIKVMSDSEKKATLLKQAYSEMISWRKRYSALKEFSELFEIIDDIEIVHPKSVRGIAR